MHTANPQAEILPEQFCSHLQRAYWLTASWSRKQLPAWNNGRFSNDWIAVIIWSNVRHILWDCTKSPYLFRCPQIMLSFFLLLSFSQVVGSLYLKCVFFPPFCGCESKCNLFLSCSFHFDFMLYSCPFMILSFCIIFLSCSFHVPLMFHYFLFMFLSFSFHVPLYNYIMLLYIPFMFLSCSFHVPFIWHSCPFIFRRYVSNIQVFERWYVQTDQVDISPKTRVFIIFRYRFCYRVATVWEACAGCHLQGSWTCTCISSLSFFLLWSFSGPSMHW